MEEVEYYPVNRVGIRGNVFVSGDWLVIFGEMSDRDLLSRV